MTALFHINKEPIERGELGLAMCGAEVAGSREQSVWAGHLVSNRYPVDMVTCPVCKELLPLALL